MHRVFEQSKIAKQHKLQKKGQLQSTYQVLVNVYNLDEDEFIWSLIIIAHEQ